MEKNTRIEILKTYKLYIGGAFPRTESGRYYKINDSTGKHAANVCLCSRKDVRNAVEAARAAFGGWSERAAFNKSQILYRIAEILESRKQQFIAEIMLQGIAEKDAEKEVHLSIDRLVYYAGWCDKFQQIFSSVNPVASSHFNFSVPEPSGVVSILASQNSALLGLVSLIAPAIAGGNTCIVLAAEKLPLSAISFAEVLNDSDVPGGVVNILTGKSSELITWMAEHMDINAIVYGGDATDEIKLLQEKSATNLKRISVSGIKNWEADEAQSPYFILSTQEIKTTWHPIEKIKASGVGY